MVRPISCGVDSSWFLITLSAVLAGVAVVLGVFGLSGHWLAVVLAVGLAAVSYALWRVGRDRMISHIYADVGAEEEFDDAEGGSAEADGADPEDWHREGFQYADADPAEWEGIDDPADVDPEGAFFDGAFWREWERAREERAREGADGGGRERRQSSDGRTDGTRTDGTRADGSGVSVDPRTAEACRVLDVDPDADEEELKRAYRRRVKETHPDLGGSEAAFRQVREAYEHLRE